MAPVATSYNDGILLCSLVYSCIDLGMEWDSFAVCPRPIHKWLLASYALVGTFRLLHHASSRLSNGCSNAAGGSGQTGANGEYLLDLRQKSFMARAILAFNWCLLVPAFVLWTILGTYWLWQIHSGAPDSMPSFAHMCFAWAWIALCYASLAVHASLGVASLILERRLRKRECDLRQIEDADSISRWGRVSSLDGYSALSPLPDSAGLTPAEIKSLPGEAYYIRNIGRSDVKMHNTGTTVAPLDAKEQNDAEEGVEADEKECAICLTCFDSGDSVRHLPTCAHTFHRSCIDLWLLRSAECPLCKRSARPKADS